MVHDQYLSTANTAKALGVSRQTIHQWVRAGRLQAIRVGHRLRFRAADVLAFMLAAGMTQAEAAHRFPEVQP
jgi:excisionase family DNA binding protein